MCLKKFPLTFLSIYIYVVTIIWSFSSFLSSFCFHCLCILVKTILNRKFFSDLSWLLWLLLLLIFKVIKLGFCFVLFKKKKRWLIWCEIRAFLFVKCGCGGGGEHVKCGETPSPTFLILLDTWKKSFFRIHTHLLVHCIINSSFSFQAKTLPTATHSFFLLSFPFFCLLCSNFLFF